MTVENVEDYLRAVSTRGGASKPVALDWRDLRSVETAAGAVLSNALLGTLGALDLELLLPGDPAKIHSLTRSGLLFALANRPGQTIFRGYQETVRHAQWRRTWTPADRDSLRRLFRGAENVEEFDQQELFPLTILGESETPTLFGRYHAAFVNPHRTSLGRGPSEVVVVLRSWLHRVLPSQRDVGGLPRHGRRLLRDISHIVDELLDNVIEHAPRTVNGQPSDSLVQVVVTRGGAERSNNRIYLSVQDTGPGVVATARRKSAVGVESLSDPELVRSLFLGDLSWHRGRAGGLHSIWSRCCEWPGSKMWVFSRTLRLAGEGGELVSRPGGFDAGGTGIVVMIPEPQFDAERAVESLDGR